MIAQEVNNLSTLKNLLTIRNEVRSFMTGSQDFIDWETQKKWFSSLNHDLIKIWIYGEHENEWFGYGQLRIEPGNIIFGVSSHAVTEKLRGKGYGEKILVDLISQARKLNCDAMRAEIFKTNKASLGLVYKLGYKNTKDLGDIWEVQLPLK